MDTRSSPLAPRLLVVAIVVAVALVAVVVWAVTTRGDDDARVSTVQDSRIQSVLSACAAPDSGLRSPGVGVLDISYPGGEPTDVFTTALECVVRETRMPSDVNDRLMYETRARDSAAWSGWDAAWTFDQTAGLHLNLRAG